MSHRAGVFRELRISQYAYVIDTFYRAGRFVAQHIGREFLLSEDGKAFFQRQLEPISAGDAIAGPVMEIFVSDDGFNIGEVLIGCDVLISQNIFGVKDVQAFVFHGAEVEVVGRHNHEAV